MRKLIEKNPVVAILRNVPLDSTKGYLSAVLSGGSGAVEIALNSKDALKQIETAKLAFGDKMAVGAGTAVTVTLVKEAVQAGADFLLSPSADRDVLEYCAEQGIKLLPGVMTPSDVSLCLRCGFDLLKLFPAGDLPPHYLKSLKGPFDKSDYVAVGGVKKENAASFFAQGFLGVGVGSNLIPNELQQAGNWEQAAVVVQEFMREVPRTGGNDK